MRPDFTMEKCIEKFNIEYFYVPSAQKFLKIA